MNRNASQSFLSVRAMSIATLVLLIVSLVPPPVQAEDNVRFIDTTVKKYNDVVFSRFELVEPLILENSFRVMEETEIYLQLIPTQTNMPIIDPDWKVRFKLLNSTWSYTDFGDYSSDNPTGLVTLSPTGEDYTLQTKVYYPVHDVRIGEVYEVMIALVEKKAGSFQPSYSLQHYVQFTEEDPLSPRIDFLLIGLVGAIITLAIIMVVMPFKYPKDDVHGKKKKSKRRRKKKR